MCLFTGKEDKPFMFESLVFMLLMVICSFGLVDALVKVAVFLAQNVNINPSP